MTGENFLMRPSLIRPESDFGKQTFLGKILDVLRTNFFGAVENRDYGNLDILAEYCGVSTDSKVMGRIQHGWAVFSVGETYYRNDFANTFVWTRKAQVWATSMGWNNYIDIGAPWLYLLKLLERDGWIFSNKLNVAEKQDKELWVYGNHSDVTLKNVPQELLDFFNTARSSSKEITILLQYRDYDSIVMNCPELITGLNVVTLGQRTNSATANAHLFRIFHLLSQFKIIVIDWPSSLLLYGITLNCEVRFLESDQLKLAIKLAIELGDFELVDVLSKSRHTGSDLQSFALSRLGNASLKEPEELRELLNWRKASLWWILLCAFSLPVTFMRIALRSTSARLIHS